jgi:enolase
MLTLVSLRARQILDSRGNPTVECEAVLSDGSLGRAAVPSGASTGTHEAVERRDGGDSFGGKSVLGAIETIHTTIKSLLTVIDPFDQAAVDHAMITADGTANKSVFGANAILAVSLAVAKACAQSSGVTLYQYVAAMAGTTRQLSLPMPMINIMNGGQHADFATDIQEYMIVPVGASTMADALERSANVFHALAGLLKTDGHAVTVGDEGGYAPRLSGGNTAPLNYILRAIETCGYRPGVDMAIALDVAASEFYEDGHYVLRAEQRQLDATAISAYIGELAGRYPLVSVEDGLDENDWEHWPQLTESLGRDLWLVGDDLLVTNVARLKQAIEAKAGNTILIKPNQIGTLSETIEAVTLAAQHGWRTIMSHRSGETEDTTIAHLAVALGCDAIKSGSLSRSERVAKYNELLRIAEAEPTLVLRAWGGTR